MNKWYIRGSKELREYFMTIKIPNLLGDEDRYGYMLNQTGHWYFAEIMSLKDHTEITLDQYLNQNKIKNTFIEVLDEAHGQRVKEFFLNQGCINKDNLKFDCYKLKGSLFYYYGVYQDDVINIVNLKDIEKRNCKIITLPEETMNTQTIKRIDLIKLRSQVKCPEFITKIDGYLMANMLLSDEHQIEIQSQDLTLLKEKGSKEQIAAVESYGVKLKNELPQSWEELENSYGYYIDTYSRIIQLGKGSLDVDNKNTWPTKELAEASLALSQLMQIREVWINGETKFWYIIKNTTNGLTIYNVGSISLDVISFPTREMAAQFFNAPEINKLLQIAKPLL